MKKLIRKISDGIKEEKRVNQILMLTMLSIIAILSLYFIIKYFDFVIVLGIFLAMLWFDNKQKAKEIESIQNPDLACHQLLFDILSKESEVLNIHKPDDLLSIFPVNESKIQTVSNQPFYRYIVKPKSDISEISEDDLEAIKQVIATNICQKISTFPNIIKPAYLDCPALYIFRVEKSLCQKGYLTVDILNVYNNTSYNVALTLSKVNKKTSEDVSISDLDF